jgi:hypothetical protein
MNELPDAFLAAWFERANGASNEALAVFLTLVAIAPASTATLAKRLGLPQAKILRALAELSSPAIALVTISEGSGRSGKRTVTLTTNAVQLHSLLELR